ncbi:hypothetical protein SL103_18665 [Streptomyces lydicus]|uniref:Transcriptional regulator n=1 Tax=Streptomyces lydicus TaxID=47763 RepID=A0A1D7VMK6_9ACTN|nr:hypothetical protein SL103_18665 [Streptomyces lydicus]
MVVPDHTSVPMFPESVSQTVLCPSKIKRHGPADAAGGVAWALLEGLGTNALGSLAALLVGAASHIETDPRLPSPFTPKGTRQTGPAWYSTSTVAYAVELGATIQPSEAYVRHEHGAYFDAWYTRLRDAYMATMADLGVEAGMSEADFLAAMARHKSVGPGQAAALSAIKSTVKGGIGKLRERPQGIKHKFGEPWPALSAPPGARTPGQS